MLLPHSFDKQLSTISLRRGPHPFFSFFACVFSVSKVGPVQFFFQNATALSKNPGDPLLGLIEVVSHLGTLILKPRAFTTLETGKQYMVLASNVATQSVPRRES